MSIIDPVTGEVRDRVEAVIIYPAKHFVLPDDKVDDALQRIRKELNERLEELRSQDKLLEAQRLSARTRYDMEMIQQVGYCPGVENYSLALSGRESGTPPDTLYSFFPDDFLLFVDESHVSVPQIRGMQSADRNRKKTLIEHGFRLPSALDNRPLSFTEWEGKINQAIFVSATPGVYEQEHCPGKFIEQVIRPTGLLDPEIEVLPAKTQVADLLEQVKERIAKKERVLVTALTKRLAEDVSAYFVKKGIRCKWLHSELDAFERVDLLTDLREGKFDVLVGVNLLREGLDLPEVSLVAILDADKEGFLRSETSLMQTIGRAARNVNSKVILYGDKMTDSMQKAITETNRRRELQRQYNEANGITPQTVKRAISKGIQAEADAHAHANAAAGMKNPAQYITEEYINELESQMLEAADNLEFERAAGLRDRIEALKGQVGVLVSEAEIKAPKSNRPQKGRRGRKK